MDEGARVGESLRRRSVVPTRSRIREARFVATLALIPLAPVSALAAAPTPAEIAKAKSVFADARAMSAKDGGHLWGTTLYGRMMLVDPGTRTVIANEADAGHLLEPEDGVYVGTLPSDLIPANAPTEWGGERWTQLLLPGVPEDAVTRNIMLTHEMFHRIQPGLHLMAKDSLNPQLDTEKGRVWLRLEWRALAAALVETGSAQTQAIRDALAFRDHRHALFPGSAATEASLEIAEGIPQYTGTVVAEPDAASARWRAAADLARPDTGTSFVRSFAYVSGPGYGLLLDERMPGWRKNVSEKSDLAAMLGSTLPSAAPESAAARAAVYGAAGIKLDEADRAARLAATLARYRAALVDGPTLVTPPPAHFGFNPGTVVSLGADGNVYPTFHAVAPWGTLDVTGGVLVPADFSRAAVPAPASIKGPHLHGEGWTIDLAPGWSVVPGAKPGNYRLVKPPH
jgi:hypothetical protein